MHASMTTFWEAEHASAGRFSRFKPSRNPPHLDAGGMRSSDDVRSAVMSGKRHDEIGPALIEHRLIAGPKGFEASLDFTPVKRFRKQALLGASRNALSHLIGQSFVR